MTKPEQDKKNKLAWLSGIEKQGVVQALSATPCNTFEHNLVLQNNAIKTKRYGAATRATPETPKKTILEEKPRFDFGVEKSPSRYKTDDLINGVPISTIRERAGNDWDQCMIDQPLLDWLAQSVADEQKRLKGIVPDGWVEIVNCSGCGFVYLWEGCPSNVLGCPWCHVRAKGITIPRPGDTTT